MHEVACIHHTLLAINTPGDDMHNEVMPIYNLETDRWKENSFDRSDNFLAG